MIFALSFIVPYFLFDWHLKKPYHLFNEKKRSSIWEDLLWILHAKNSYIENKIGKKCKQDGLLEAIAIHVAL